MSSLRQLSLEIDRFLLEEQAEAICISGIWGVGKTYTWNRLYEKAVSEGRVSRTRYSYASLFGISSLDTLKNTIFENTNIIIDPNDNNTEVAEIKKHRPLSR